LFFQDNWIIMNAIEIEYYEEVKASVFIQMAIDEFLLNSAIRRKNKNIIFRFHNVYPYGVTLGANQKINKVVIDKLTLQKINYTYKH